jgi:hypothetical protein
MFFHSLKEKKWGKKHGLFLGLLSCGIMSIYNNKLHDTCLKQNRGKTDILIHINVQEFNI